MTIAFERLRSALAERYALSRQIGVGGMAAVYLAVDRKHGRNVAVKVLRPELAAALGPERFLREIQIAAGLHHPHILPLYDSGEADGLLYYVMPYVDGESLRDRLHRERQLPLNDALQIAREVADAMAYAHQRGLIHRDIKPENILLEGGHAMVADFGIARAVESAATSRLTETGLALGTPGYMSPEQALGEAVLDVRSDVYALGCVLYEMLAGEPPFAAATAQASIARRLTEPAPRITVFRDAVPAHVERAIITALARVPADRFASAAAFRDALDGDLRPPDATAAARRGWSSSRKRFVFMTAITLAVVALVVAGIRMSPAVIPPTPPPDDAPTVPAVAVLPFRTLGADLEFWREGMVDLLSFNLEGLGELRKIDPATVMTAWKASGGTPSQAVEPRVALEIARRVSARYAVTGSVVQLGHGVRLVAQVHDADRGELRGTAQVEGPVDSVSWLVDQLTMELLRQNLVPSDGEQHPVNLSRVTTTSLGALKAYLDGEREFRVAHWSEAVRHYQRAIDLDSTFARALYRLARAYGWEGSELSEEYGRRAERLADRLPERDAMLVRAVTNGGFAPLKALTRRYPDDAEGWVTLGDRYYHVGTRALLPNSAYRGALTKAIELSPNYGEAYDHLIEDAFFRLDSVGAQRLIKDYSALGAEHRGCTLQLTYDLVWGNNIARQRALAALDTVSNSGAMWDCVHSPLAAPPRVLDRMARLYQEAMEDSSATALDRSYLLWKLLMVRVPRGQITAARQALARAQGMSDTEKDVGRWHIQLHLSGFPDSLGAHRALRFLTETKAPVPTDLFWAGAVAVAERRWRDVDRSSRALDQRAQQLKVTGDTSEADFAKSYADVLRAYLGLARGERGRLPEFESALGRLPPYGFTIEQPQLFLRFKVGQMLFDWGQMRDAERYFDGFNPYAFVYNSTAELYLGRITEALGRPDEAIGHYRRFLRWWQPADAALGPELEEGVEALGRLSREPRN
jgi:tetratricopeptide (TPR) repeat protein/TolB-like protein